MKTRRTIDPKTVREYLGYDPDTGLLYWIKKPSRGVRAGATIGSHICHTRQERP